MDFSPPDSSETRPVPRLNFIFARSASLSVTLPTLPPLAAIDVLVLKDFHESTKHRQLSEADLAVGGLLRVDPI